MAHEDAGLAQTFSQPDHLSIQVAEVGLGLLDTVWTSHGWTPSPSP